MSAIGRWLRSLADTVDPQVPPARFSGGMAETEYRERICQWARDNGLDPNEIPEDSEFVIGRDTVTVDVVLRDAAGTVVINGNSVMRTKKTVPLLTPFPTSARQLDTDRSHPDS
ncbi:hypothetical protein PSN13_06515 [Micromonospora saelicesensis]|uniref:Uncharacterized protein n=1 Tax=Micromonospora saelicesensis TaxID=285676 RepID=A0A328NC31_9ACTN|nr:hypothetical protein [Micromonospora saelicesensis]RAO26487.1 hypothetical protein PSN13_06515 [Micromonospora saelicesensis]